MTLIIEHEGLELEVVGTYDQPDRATGYKGGFSAYQIYINGVDWYGMIKDTEIEQINYKCAELC